MADFKTSLAAAPSDCPLCTTPGGVELVHRQGLRIVRIDDPQFPAYYRVIAQQHVGEWTDLDPTGQAAMLAAINTIEHALRTHLNPSKINIASLGNMVHHLHWHVVARFTWDSHFPGSIWSEVQREVAEERLESVREKLVEVDSAIGNFG